MPVEQQQTEMTPTPDASQTKRKGVALKALLVVLVVAALTVAMVIWSGLSSRAEAGNSLRTETNQLAIPAVSVVAPKVTPGAEEIALPGNMQAFIDTPIWARASGYLKAWYVDIGARVKQGQLLAEIETPEVDQQLLQARAQLQTADANLKLSQVTADRYTELFKTDSVAKQDVDNAVQGEAARKADVASAQANVSRLEQLVAYEKGKLPSPGFLPPVTSTSAG